MVNLDPGSSRPLHWNPWEAKDFKELHKSMVEDGPNFPWAQTLLEDITYHVCIPRDWLDVTKAVPLVLS